MALSPRQALRSASALAAYQCRGQPLGSLQACSLAFCSLAFTSELHCSICCEMGREETVEAWKSFSEVASLLAWVRCHDMNSILWLLRPRHGVTAMAGTGNMFSSLFSDGTSLPGGRLGVPEGCLSDLRQGCERLRRSGGPTFDSTSALVSFCRSRAAAFVSSFRAAMWRAGRRTLPFVSFSSRRDTTWS